MNQEIFEWLLLLGRWLHITTAITWIGTSIFFMWLDRTFVPNEKSTTPGHVGELWMVHGGGFYKVEKMLMGPTKVPEHLHWFKWESYWTWFSGAFLIFLIFYTGNGSALLDASVSKISYWQAVGLGLASMILSWLVYDFLWETAFTKKYPWLGHAFTLLWLSGMSYLLCHILSGRAAYIHIGAMLGTWMTANVFLRIIPRQVKMVEAAKNNSPVNQDWAKNAKNRSTHNTYFTLPVIFIMMSNHFPSTYGNKWNWIILLSVIAAGAAIRHFFVIRLQKPETAKAFAGLGVAILIAVILFSRENPDAPSFQKSVETDAGTVESTAITGGQTLQGVVSFVGTPPTSEKLLLPPGCVPAGHGDVYNNDFLLNAGHLQNVLIRVTQGLEGKTFPPAPKRAAILDQKNCMYVPRVIAVRVGQPVDFINSDAIFHNVRTVTKNNDDFNIAMPNQNDRMTQVFTKPEIFLQTKCSVHPWMAAYVAVVDHPFFAVSNSEGAFKIDHLPEGKYTIEAWHELLGTQTREIEITAAAPTKIEFTFKQ